MQVLILALTGACFCVAYPMMLHPLILFALGISRAPDEGAGMGGMAEDGPSPPMRVRDPRVMLKSPPVGVIVHTEDKCLHASSIRS